MANQINDGVVAFGSRVITTSRAQTFQTDDFDYTPGKKSVTRTDANDKPTGKVTTKGVTEGKATFQFVGANINVSGAGTVPQYGDTFSEIEGTFVIDQVGEMERKDGESKIPVTFYLVLNPAQLSVT